MRGVNEWCAATPAVVLALILLQRGVGTQGAMAAAGEGEVTPTPPDVPDFWPEVANDLRRVTWAHAVNSRKLLDKALEGDALMLEADVSIASDGKTPIMAHPPATEYDITLEDFLNAVIKSGKKKGIKLDFKSTASFESAVPILTQMEARSPLHFPLWFNADIAAGPGGATVPDVSAPKFLATCKEHFPGRTLSLGWTTGVKYGENALYTEEHVQAMEAILNAANVTAHQPITFAVRDTLAARSALTLLPMLQARPVATLTVWGTAIDKLVINVVKDKAKKITSSIWRKIKGILPSRKMEVAQINATQFFQQQIIGPAILVPDNEALLELVNDAGFERVYLDLPKFIPGLSPDPSTPAPGVGAGALAGVAWTPLLAAAALATAVAAAMRRF